MPDWQYLYGQMLFLRLRVTLTLPSYSDHPEHCHDNCREFQVTLPLWKGNHSLLGGEEKAFAHTGIASLAYNTIYKIYYMQKTMPSLMESADKMLLMPNLIEYLFSGVLHTEYSIASTTQLYDMKEKKRSAYMIDQLRIPKEMFTTVDLAGKD